uniref:Uncharacterized protein n=1 Tax=Candidatus Kentrum sp. LPFa TaxID=2126335 RepID=A0A450WS83_9GAMM|nr:MAG: hypothetical protein BECKLPF1236B_GA0070989_11904 [Candidatus Kentron sp. LPFa]
MRLLHEVQNLATQGCVTKIQVFDFENLRKLPIFLRFRFVEPGMARAKRSLYKKGAGNRFSRALFRWKYQWK